MEIISEQLKKLSEDSGYSISSQEFASFLDSRDELSKYRDEFTIPDKSVYKKCKPDQIIGEPCLYLCSNSLGLLPKRTRELINQELDAWGARGVVGHTEHPYGRPWVTMDDNVTPYMAEIVGAKTNEVAIMATLTSNIHFLLTAFYKPTTSRFKILMEDKAFPSDYYAVESQLKLKNINPEEAIIIVKPREGESTIRDQDILEIIKEQGSSIAIVFFSGVQYYTGQLFDMKSITKAGHEQGCFVGFDLAHAVGNVLVSLHDWEVDFACWCTYKYLSSGPGNIGGLFVHECHSNNPEFPRLVGWWAHRLDTRFQMTNGKSDFLFFNKLSLEMDLCPGAYGFRHSNPSATNCVALLGSLEIYHESGMNAFRTKSKLLTGYLEYLLLTHPKLKNRLKIMTPSEPERRGSQLSLLLNERFEEVFFFLCERGVVCDERHPNCIRVGPYPFVNTFSEMLTFTNILVEAFESVKN